MKKSRYKRVLLKLSGAALTGDERSGIDFATLSEIAHQIRQVLDMGAEVAIVVGGGNIWRGTTAEEMGMERTNADYAGMLATLLNALALQDTLEKAGVFTRIQSAITVAAICEPFIRRRALRHMEKGRVVIFACGTGNPYFTTDTAAALRAIEIGAEVLLMAKYRVDGVYDADPQKNPDAKRFDSISHDDALKLHLKVTDATAMSLCMENNLPIIVFDVAAPQSIVHAVEGDVIGTIVSSQR
ncbi:MAG: UMP kinase [Chloroflexota bacterium]|nr:UMP kinase [Chloroflexota bacterium]